MRPIEASLRMRSRLASRRDILGESSAVVSTGAGFRPGDKLLERCSFGRAGGEEGEAVWLRPSFRRYLHCFCCLA